MLAPASAQIDDRFPFLEDRRRRYQQNQPYQQPQWGAPFGFEQPRQQPAEFLARAARRAAPRSRRRPRVMVFGDSMADWLAFGLEEAFSDTPEIGVLRKHRTNSGLIRVEVRGESYDWPNAARDMLNAEKPDYVVMIIGVADRRGIREAIRQQPARPPQNRSSSPAARKRKRRRSSAATTRTAAGRGAPRAAPAPAQSRRTPKHRRKARRRTPRRTAINRTSSRRKPRSPERWCTNSGPRSGASSIRGASMK